MKEGRVGSECIRGGVLQKGGLHVKRCLQKGLDRTPGGRYQNRWYA